MKDMSSSGQFRESRHTRTIRDPEGAGSIMFPERRLLDLAQGRTGMTVDILRLTNEGLTLGRVVSGGHEITLEDPEHITLLLPIDGRIAVQTGGKEHGFNSGSVILMQAEKRRTRVVAPKGGVFRATTVQVSRSRFAALMAADLGKVGEPGVDFRLIDTTIGRQIRLLLPGLADDLFRQSDRFLTPRAKEEFASLIDDFLVDSTANGSDETRLYGGLREFQRVSRACDIIHARAEEALSITRLAAELGVTPRSLQLSFRAVHGVSPRQYLERVRLDRVRLMIRMQGEASSVTTAALECGFLHLGRFSQAYRRTFGELPSETRSRLRHPVGRTVSHSG